MMVSTKPMHAPSLFADEDRPEARQVYVGRRVRRTQKDFLKKLAKRLGTDVSGIIGEALDEWLKKRGHAPDGNG